MEEQIFRGTYKGKADLSGRVVIPRKLRKERVFYVSLKDRGLDLYPTSNLSDNDLMGLQDSRVTLDGQNRVDLSAYCDRYDLAGKDVVILGLGERIKILTSRDHKTSIL